MSPRAWIFRVNRDQVAESEGGEKIEFRVRVIERLSRVTGDGRVGDPRRGVLLWFPVRHAGEGRIWIPIIAKHSRLVCPTRKSVEHEADS